jgi:hypothetical protein
MRGATNLRKIIQVLLDFLKYSLNDYWNFWSIQEIFLFFTSQFAAKRPLKRAMRRPLKRNLNGDRGGGGNPKDSYNDVNPHMKARVLKVYRHFRTATMGGCNGRSTGHDGSLAPIWMFRVLQFLGVFGETVVDLGASDGRVLASALACGTDKVFGHEHPENKACKFVFDAVLKSQ